MSPELKLAQVRNGLGASTVKRTEQVSDESRANQPSIGFASTKKVRPGWTFLHSAVEKGRIESVKAALDAGISPNCETEDKAWTPLWVAACFGNREIIEILLNAGAKVNATTNDGLTAVHEAAKIGATDVIDLLIRHGADLDIPATEYAETPLISAAAKGYTATVKALLTAGAKVRVAQYGGWTALHYALQNRNSEMACMILEYSPDTNAASLGGTRPLHLAAWAGMTSVAGLLLDMGAERDAVDSGGSTALRFAAQEGELETVKLLIERGAETDVVTLMDIAVIQGHKNLYQYLQLLSAA